MDINREAVINILMDRGAKRVSCKFEKHLLKQLDLIPILCDTK